MKKITDTVLNWIYPHCCPVCHKILKDQKSLVCPACAGKLKRAVQPRCMKCGRPTGPEEEYCADCASRERAFTQGEGIYVYDRVMKNSLMYYKYFGRREYGNFYARAMYHYAGADIKRWRPDLIVPVPLHKRKQRQRGFNQSEYLARRLGKYCGIPVSASVLLKVRPTGSQKKLDAARRRRNLRDAFRVTERLDGLNILVIDDVYTTGSTLEAAASCLRESGAKNVYFLTLCMGLNREIADL